MSDVETLRRAAALMRERAEDALAENDWKRGIAKLGRLTPKGQHMASWPPAVALGVADMLSMAADHAAGRSGPDGACGSCVDQALVVARAYLG